MNCGLIEFVALCRELGNRFGVQMKYIWAIGLFAAGQSSTMTGTYTGQKTMEGFMDIKMAQWKRTLITRSVAMVPTIGIAVMYAGSEKMDELNQLLNIVQSIQLPFALIPVYYITSRSDIMGEKFVLKAAFQTFIQGLSSFLLGLNLLLVVQEMLGGRMLKHAPHWVLIIVSIVTILYALFVVYLLVGPAAVWRVLDGRENAVARLVQRMFGHPRRDTYGLSPLSAARMRAHHVNVSQLVEDMVLEEEQPPVKSRW
jgi:Mn2+/Fe2+ NRAMP family transporter